MYLYKIDSYFRTAIGITSTLSRIPKYFACYCCYSEYITSNYANKSLNANK